MSEVPRKPRPARADTGTDPNYEVGYGRPPSRTSSSQVSAATRRVDQGSRVRFQKP